MKALSSAGPSATQARPSDLPQGTGPGRSGSPEESSPRYSHLCDGWTVASWLDRIAVLLHLIVLLDSIPDLKQRPDSHSPTVTFRFLCKDMNAVHEGITSSHDLITS